MGLKKFSVILEEYQVDGPTGGLFVPEMAPTHGLSLMRALWQASWSAKSVREWIGEGALRFLRFALN